METYLDRIKQKKNELKLTNDQLAERSGIPLGTLSKILAGMSDSPKLSNMIAISGALGCSIEYIVNGTPENDHNYTLTAAEIAMVEQYRALDTWGRSLVESVIAKESERALAQASAEVPADAPTEHRARILTPTRPLNRYAGEPRVRTGKRAISLFDLPVSAGVGVYLDEDTSESIQIPDNEKTAEADYALRISGNSMEPKYHNGDILLVQTADAVENGELGIFLLDGAGFFKVFGGDRLLSLNPSFAPIMLKDYRDVRCKGRVVGKLKRK